MVFALPGCRQGQPMVCKARLWLRIGNLGSERLFLPLPWLFLPVGEEAGTPRTQVSSLGTVPGCPKPSTGLPASPRPREQEPKFPSQQQRSANPVLGGEAGLRAGGGRRRWQIPALTSWSRKMYYP